MKDANIDYLGDLRWVGPVKIDVVCGDPETSEPLTIPLNNSVNIAVMRNKYLLVREYRLPEEEEKRILPPRDAKSPGVWDCNEMCWINV